MGGKGSGRHASRMSSAHGEVQRYARGCRCTRCRGAWASYMRDRRAKLGARQKPYYPGKVEAKIVQLTPLGLEILQAAQAREQRPPADIVEHLLRLYGRDVHFNEGTAA